VDAALAPDAAIDRDGGPSPSDAGPPPGCSAADLDACEYAIERAEVEVLEGLTLRDPELERDNDLLLRYPAGATEPLPVVIYSHGGELNDGGHRSARAWGEAIAAAGYLFIHVEHAEATAAQARTLCLMAGALEEECAPELFNVAQVAKPRDVIMLLDDLENIASRLEVMAGVQIDPDRVVTMGHSSGSQPGLVLAGTVRELTPSLPRFMAFDDRPIATIALSPQGPGFGGFFELPAETSWSNVTRPTLVMTGDNDINSGNDELTGPIRRRAWENLPGGNGDQFLLYSHLEEGVGAHPTYNLGDVRSGDPRLIDLSRALVSVARAFLDHIVRGDAAALEYLSSEHPAILAGSDTDWLAK
jgi:hypothetical protein